MTLMLQAALVLALLAALATVPFGLPGVWIMVAILLIPTLAGWISGWVWLVLAASSLLAEGAEFLVLKRVGDRFGGSRAAFWGAVGGGFLGLLIGIPVPIVGSLIAAIVGTFLGAALVTWLQTRSTVAAGRVGWGMALARVLAIFLKVGTGVAILAVAVGAMLLGG